MFDAVDCDIIVMRNEQIDLTGLTILTTVSNTDPEMIMSLQYDGELLHLLHSLIDAAHLITPCPCVCILPYLIHSDTLIVNDAL